MALNGKTAVVTGAAMGIGREITEKLLQNGAKVALLDANEAAGERLKEILDRQYGAGRSLFLKCDVESEEQVRAALQKAVEAFGGVDVLCNNAGILNEAEWEKTISINLVAVVRVTYLALECMSQRSGGRGGVVVNTASMAGLGPLMSCPVYTASKHGVVGFTRAMAAASVASGYGVRFNVLCPGFVQTELFSNILHRLGPFSHLAAVTRSFADSSGTTTVSQVAECLLELVTNETKNGEAFMVTPRGKKYMMFPALGS